MIGETPLETPPIGAMSFLPKLSRELETLLMLRGATLVLTVLKCRESENDKACVTSLGRMVLKVMTTDTSVS